MKKAESSSASVRTTGRGGRASRLSEKLRASQTSLDGGADDAAAALAAGDGASGGLATVIQLLAKVRASFQSMSEGPDCTCFIGCVVRGGPSNTKFSGGLEIAPAAMAAGDGASGGLATVIQLLAKVRAN